MTKKKTYISVSDMLEIIKQIENDIGKTLTKRERFIAEETINKTKKLLDNK